VRFLILGYNLSGFGSAPPWRDGSGSDWGIRNFKNLGLDQVLIISSINRLALVLVGLLKIV